LFICLFLIALAPSNAEDDACAELWSIAGAAGGNEPWLASKGFQIGMDKAEADHIRSAGRKGSIARDRWQYQLMHSHIVVEFEDGKLAAASWILDGRELKDAYSDCVETLGLPQDAGKGYVLWRSESCDTVKILLEQEGNLSLVIQSQGYFEKNSVSRKGG
jgi:hypothetical protein